MTFLADFERAPFDDGTIRRDTYRGPVRGPAVIVMHELPGVTQRTVDVARAIESAGFTIVLPALVGRPRARGSIAGGLRNLADVMFCMAREFEGLSLGRRGRLVDWLRALAAREAQRAGHQQVGVVGMCLSGGFAIAMAVDPIVGASVTSQPAVPFAIPGLRRELGVTRDELRALRDRDRAGLRIRALRYQRDALCPRARFQRLSEVMPHASIVEIPTWSPFDHAVLSNGARPGTAPDSELGRAFRATIDYLATTLARPDAAGTPREPRDVAPPPSERG